MPNRIFQFQNFTLNTHTRELLFQNKPVQISSKAYEILLFLLENKGEIVTKDQILDTVWKDTFVEEANLPVHISALRRLLKEKKGESKFIKTISGKGYSFVEDVQKLPDSQKPHTTNQTSVLLYSTTKLAILPFVTIGNSKKNDFLKSVIPQGIISDLSEFKELKILSFSSFNNLTDKKLDLDELGFLFDADFIFAGYLSSIKGKYLLNVELIDISDKTVLWGTELDFRFEDFLEIKTNLSEQIAENLNVKTSKSKISQSKISPEALKLYYRGKHILESRGSKRSVKQVLFKALEYFQTALRVEENFALAYFGIGSVYVSLHNHHFIDKQIAYENALESSNKAIQLNKNLSEALVLKGTIHFMFELQLKTAFTYFEKAANSNTNNADAYHWQSLYHLSNGNFEQATNLEHKAIELEPLSRRYNEQLLRIFYYADEFEKAITQAEEILTFDDQSITAKIFIALSYAKQGLFELALDYIDETIEFTKLKSIYSFKVQILCLANSFQPAKKILQNLKSFYADKEINQYDFAVIYSSLGDTENAINALYDAFAEKNPSMCLIKVDSAFHHLRDNSRFRKLLDKMGLQ